MGAVTTGGATVLRGAFGFILTVVDGFFDAAFRYLNVGLGKLLLWSF